MSKVLSLRLQEEQVKRLEKFARRIGRSKSQAAAILLEEALRMDEFPDIEFRDTIVGRQTFLKKHRLKIWQIEWLAGTYERDLDAMSEAFGVPRHRLEAALRYADAYPEEMEEAIQDNHKSFEELQRILPNIERFSPR